MAFDRAAAKAAGYSDAEIDAYLQANPEVAKETPPAPATASEDVPPPPSTVIPEVDRTAEALATGGLALADVGAALPYAAGAYGAYKGAQLANVGLEAVKGYGQRTAVNEFNTLMNNYSKMNNDVRQYQKAGQQVPQSLLDAQAKLGQQIEAAQSRISTTPVESAPKAAVNPATAPGAQAAPKAMPQAPAPTAGPVAPQTAPAQAMPYSQAAGTAAEKPGMLKNFAQMAGKYGTALAESPLGKTLGGAARIAGSAPAMGAQMGLYSGDLNQGEPQAMARTRALQDTISKMPMAQQSFYFTLPQNKKQQVDQMIMNGQDPSALLIPNAFNSGFAQQLNTMGR